MTKRIFDIVFSLLGIVILSPLMIVCALLVKLTSRGPVLFSQQRVGKGFQPFSIYKFRSMIVGAPKMGAQITADRDPRITTVGRVMRKLKLDELPQLFNVLRGDMSFVGPRPEVPHYVEMFRDDYRDLLRFRPGITDISSITYRFEEEILAAAEDPQATYVEEVLPAKIALSKTYAQKSSLWYDVKLIFATIFKISSSHEDSENSVDERVDERVDNRLDDGSGGIRS